MAVAVAVAVAVSGGGAVAVAVAGLTKRFFNHIQKDFLINVWGYRKFHIGLLYVYAYLGPGKVLRAQINSPSCKMNLTKSV